MCASPLSFLRAGPPPPRVVLLPDALFFTRSVPVTAGATPAEAAAQVELALEAVSPFPLAQLYYGWFWTPGAERALVFAAYRRRFTSDQTAEWAGVELVLPTFAAVAGSEVQPATTLILASPEGLTAVHWDAPGIPTKVLFRALAPEATDEDRARVRDELVRAIGGTKNVVDVTAMPAPDPAANDGETVFRSGDIVARLPAATAAAIDVRDKGELAALRGAHRRDLILWRVMLGSAALLLLLIVGEFALVGGRMWQEVRVSLYRGQKPRVEKIEASQRLASRIDDLVNKRLLPFEMITMLNTEGRRPPEITFNTVRASTTVGINVLTVDGVSTNAGLVSVYESTLQKVPAIERAQATITGTRGDMANFTLVVTFKSDALRPAESISQ